jgi:hypothetical protein
MRLTRNDYYRKLRAPIGDISNWLINADISRFAISAMLASGYINILGLKDSLTFMPSSGLSTAF